MAKSQWKSIVEEIIAVSPADVAAEASKIPVLTPSQRLSGNYPKGHVNWKGLSIAIETPKGGTRTAHDGSWEVSDFPAHYGYIKRSESSDGEEVDCYLGDSLDSNVIYVVDQQRLDGTFDEIKAMLAFDSRESAIATYHAGFSDGYGPARLQNVTEVSLVNFKEWLSNSDTTIPFSTVVVEMFVGNPDQDKRNARARAEYYGQHTPKIEVPPAPVPTPGKFCLACGKKAMKPLELGDVCRVCKQQNKPIRYYRSDFRESQTGTTMAKAKISEAYNPGSDREPIGKTCPECGESWKVCDSFKDAGNKPYSFCINCGHHKDCHAAGVLDKSWHMKRSLQNESADPKSITNEFKRNLKEAAPYELQRQAVIAFANEVAPRWTAEILQMRQPVDMLNHIIDQINMTRYKKESWPAIAKKLEMLKALGVESDFVLGADAWIPESVKPLPKNMAKAIIENISRLNESPEQVHPFANSARKFGYYYDRTEIKNIQGDQVLKFVLTFPGRPDLRIWTYRGGNYWSLGNSIVDTGNLQFGLEKRLSEIAQAEFAKHNYSQETIDAIARNNH